MRDVEHAAGLFMNGLAAAFYSVRPSGFQIVRPSPTLAAASQGICQRHVSQLLFNAIAGHYYQKPYVDSQGEKDIILTCQFVKLRRSAFLC